MKRASFAPFAPRLLMATASVSSGQPASQAPPAAPQQPPTLGDIFRIDQAGGTPAALERVLKIKSVKVGGTCRKGVFQPVEQNVNLYVEGGASPAAFKAGEPQQFVIIPLDVQTYGPSTLGLDPKRPDRAAQSFRITPHVALTPGEYLLDTFGVRNAEMVNNATMSYQHFAFGIVAH